MTKLLMTVAAASLALTGTVLAQESTGGAAGSTMLAGTGVTCGPTTASTGTTTDTTASTTGTTTDTTGTTTGTAATTDTTGTTTGTTATTDTTGTTGTTTDTTASTTGTTTGTTTDTTASTTGTTTGTATGGTMAGSSTMALSADNQITADTARSALTNFSTNADKFASLTAPTVVCIVDLDTIAASDTALQGEISKAQPNNAQIKSNLEANTAVLDVIKKQHPTFDINQVRALDIGPNGELVLYVSKTS
jgi:hypothetical protein